MSAYLRISIDVRDALAQLDRIQDAAKRTDIVFASIKEALSEVVGQARATVQQRGKPGYTPRHGKRRTKKTLRSTIGQLARRYQTSIVGVVGPQYPAGAHGHLVERGHRIARGGTLSRVATASAGKWRPGGPGRPPLPAGQKKTAPRAGDGRRGAGAIVGRAQAYPFMEPTWKRFGPKVQRRMVDALRKHINAAVAAGGGDRG